MNWRPTVYWGVLSLLVALIAIGLTHWITAVHDTSARALGIVFDEHPVLVRRLPRWAGEGAMPQRGQLPRIVVTGGDELLLILTPQTQRIDIVGVASDQLECARAVKTAAGASVASIVEAAKRASMVPLVLGRSSLSGIGFDLQAWPGFASEVPSGFPVTTVPIPAELALGIKAHKEGQGLIRCHFDTPLAASTTFTDRSVTFATPSSRSGAAILDVSALTNIEDLRFFGGTTLPWEGSRTRAFDATDQLLSVEWSDVAAEEQRDVVLVIIGALAAIAASTGLEALRPIVEKLTGRY